MRKTIKLLLTLCLLALPIPALAKDKLKLGKAKFKVQTEGVSTGLIIGNDFTLNMAGTRGIGGTAFLVLIFQDLADKIVNGAEFPIAAGPNGEDGKVLITFSSGSVKRSGKTKTVAADEESTLSGSVKISKVKEDGTFTAKFKIGIKNPVILKSNPLSGVFTASESRGKSAKVTGKVTAKL